MLRYISVIITTMYLLLYWTVFLLAMCSTLRNPIIVLFSVQGVLGVANADTALLYVIMCTVGPYFSSKFKSVKLMANPKFTRAWPGGCGDFKLGANYAATLHPQVSTTWWHIIIKIRLKFQCIIYKDYLIYNNNSTKLICFFFFFFW